LVVTFRGVEKAVSQQLRVTAVETDGDKFRASSVFTPPPSGLTNRFFSRVDLWPSQLFVHPTYDNPILREVQAWTKRHTPPICTFLPDRLRDANDNTVNQTNFRSLSRILFENQMVSSNLNFCPWPR
jgi:hypothetical protein